MVTRLSPPVVTITTADNDGEHSLHPETSVGATPHQEILESNKEDIIDRHPAHPEHSEHPDLQPCIFKRGGFCTIHNLEGKKYWSQNRKWSQKKDGTWGFKLTRKVEYKCIGDQKVPLPDPTVRKSLDQNRESAAKYSEEKGL